MNANELIIGNYVYCNETGNNQIITGISEEFVSLNFITFDYVSYDEIEPIPLTKEWLLNFGFKKGVRGWFKTYGRNQKFNLYMYRSLFNYVHQLQNLYSSLTNNHLQSAEQK